MAASDRSYAFRRKVYYLLVSLLRPLMPVLTHWSAAWRVRAFLFKSGKAEEWLKRYGPAWDPPEASATPPFLLINDYRDGDPAAGEGGTALPLQTVDLRENGRLPEIMAETPDCVFSKGFVLYRAGDCRPHPGFAARFAAAAAAHPEVDLWYSDEVQTDENRVEVFGKPAWDPLYFTTTGYTGRCFAIKGELGRRVLQQAAAQGALPRAQDFFAAALKLLDGRGQIGHIPVPLYSVPARAFPAPRPQAGPPPDPETWPKVSIVIPFRDRLDLLRPCLETMELTDYPDWEGVLVDNGSTADDMAAYLAALPAERFRVLRRDAPFNFSELVNLGVEAASGEIVVLMNNDITIVSPGWLKALVRLAARPGVGCVGAKLLYPNNLIQHGGMVCCLGRPIDGLAAPGQCHAGWPGESRGYFDFLASPRLASAVAGAVVAVPRRLYMALGGFDERLAVAMNDVDFCFKIWAGGHLCLWTPDSVLIHHESASRKMDIVSRATRDRLGREWALMREKWGSRLESDPWYNPNLGPDGGYGLRTPPAERTVRIKPAYKDVCL